MGNIEGIIRVGQHGEMELLFNDGLYMRIDIPFVIGFSLMKEPHYVEWHNKRVKFSMEMLGDIPKVKLSTDTIQQICKCGHIEESHEDGFCRICDYYCRWS